MRPRDEVLGAVKAYTDKLDDDVNIVAMRYDRQGFS
jgi:hypothetical protein